MYHVGIVGHERAKFTPETEAKARALIRKLLVERPDNVLVSGGCHLGGVDIFAEDAAVEIGVPMEIHRPEHLSWRKEQPGGFWARNMKIAQASDIVHVIVVKQYPESFKGQRFPLCYHCKGERPPHVKSGGCWTGIKAQTLGKPAVWHIIE